MLTFAPILLDDRRLFCTNTYSAMTRFLCTCISLCRSCLAAPYVYKRPTSRLRNSKQVLFCTNTSRRRTSPALLLVHHDPRGIPYQPEFLSLELIALQLRLSDTRGDYA